MSFAFINQSLLLPNPSHPSIFPIFPITSSLCLSRIHKKKWSCREIWCTHLYRLWEAAWARFWVCWLLFSLFFPALFLSFPIHDSELKWRELVYLPLENIAPCGKESSWLCSALQEYMALAWLKEQKAIYKTHNTQLKYIYT